MMLNRNWRNASDGFLINIVINYQLATTTRLSTWQPPAKHNFTIYFTARFFWKPWHRELQKCIFVASMRGRIWCSAKRASPKKKEQARLWELMYRFLIAKSRHSGECTRSRAPTWRLPQGAYHTSWNRYAAGSGTVWRMRLQLFRKVAGLSLSGKLVVHLLINWKVTVSYMITYHVSEKL